MEYFRESDGKMRAMNRDLEWERRYGQSDTPWDKGMVAPALTKFLEQNRIGRRVLVPGCGRGHEVRELALHPDVEVVGLDISSTAIAQARELAKSASPNRISLVEGDFFQLPDNLKGSFDWVVEHTCFCAIDPAQRPNYALAAAEALRTGGKLFAIFYLNPDTEAGPPFGVSKEELSNLFDPHFTLLEEWVPKESFPGRENRELVRVMRKR